LPRTREYCDCCFHVAAPDAPLTWDAASLPFAAGGTTLVCSLFWADALAHVTAHGPAATPEIAWSRVLLFLDSTRCHSVPIPGIEAAFAMRLGQPVVTPPQSAATAPPAVPAPDSERRKCFPLCVPAASTLPADELLRAIMNAEALPLGPRRDRALTAAEDALDDATDQILASTGLDSACSSAGMRWRQKFQAMTGHKREVLEARELYACELAFRDALRQELPAQTRARLICGLSLTRFAQRRQDVIITKKSLSHRR
jgi:hypothetical protein